MVDVVEPLADKTVLIVGAGGGVGSFATQFAANAGGNVIANVRATDAERMRAYGATETIDPQRSRCQTRSDKPARMASSLSSTWWAPIPPGLPRSPRW